MIEKRYPAQLTSLSYTAEEWTESNPILFKDEIGIESDTKLFKVGDGILPWKDLPYSFSSINEIIPGAGISINNNEISANLYYEIIEVVEEE